MCKVPVEPGLAHSKDAHNTAMALCAAPTLHGDSERRIKDGKKVSHKNPSVHRLRIFVLIKQCLGCYIVFRNKLVSCGGKNDFS